MPSSSDARRLVAANSKLVSLATAEFDRVWTTLDLYDARSVKRSLLALMPDLVVKYGEAAAGLAADLYEQWRADAGVRGMFVPAVAEPAKVAQVQASTRYAIGALYGPTPDFAAARELLTGDVLDRFVKNQSRETFAANGERDKASQRWARIPVGATCEYCTMLGSRGAVYYTDANAEAGSHGRCDCLVLPEFERGDLPEDYDPEALHGQWQAMKAERETQTSQR